MFTEADFEIMVCKTLSQNGWKYIPAEELPRQHSDVLVESMVKSALIRLNPVIAEDPSRADCIYRIVMKAITDAFGEDDMMIYSLYKYHGWTIDELTDVGYDCKNLDIRVKTIHRFVKAYCKKTHIAYS
jgi:hypothetical protein